MSNTIYPCIWFDGTAKQAAELYATAFGETTITADNGMVVMFEIGGCRIMGLNGGPGFKPNASVSLFVSFDDEASINTAWEKLSESGQVFMPINKYPWSERYGWIQDKYGVSWQLMIPMAGVTNQKIVPALMFTQSVAGRAEEAIEFYTALFPNSETKDLSRYEKGEGDVEGTIKHGRFTLNGQMFAAMDSSAPHAFTFGEGVSVVVNCDTQEEIDHYWNSLTANGGAESQCGWLKDKYGVSWQIVPSMLSKLMSDPERGQRAMQALMKMKKLDIDALQNA